MATPFLPDPSGRLRRRTQAFGAGIAQPFAIRIRWRSDGSVERFLFVRGDEGLQLECDKLWRIFSDVDHGASA
ncbi:hypothetical protein GJ654_11075 [Rhodoblastus acidophilus]|uniref:Uncharacterized protein n=1 Tax=Rhodoblastus acidophilus TaxID=1074 RepID=A0A6N8DMH8_RHOAC|nr:hypothetical protein [Rhodoblastus acidophilus]MCW2274878.1 hypothetical protein [Rhodoblastus acidophilus]MTV31538.1 hypothetical protein [Rhodoblastus acidophilus]